MASVRPMKVQSIILSKQYFVTLAAAKVWLRAHGFKTEVDEKQKTYRFRQIDPAKMSRGTFRTIEFAPGIKAVVGKMKPRRS